MISELKIKIMGQNREEKACRARSLGINPIKGGRPLKDRVVESKIYEGGVWEETLPIFMFWRLARKALHIIGVEIIM